MYYIFRDYRIVVVEEEQDENCGSLITCRLRNRLLNGKLHSRRVRCVNSFIGIQVGVDYDEQETRCAATVAVATKHTVRTHENNAVNRLLNSELTRIVQIISSVKNTTDVRV